MRAYKGDTKWHFDNNGYYACVGTPLPSRCAELSSNEVAETDRCRRVGCVEQWPGDHASVNEVAQLRAEKTVTAENEQELLLKIVAGLSPASAQEIGAALGKLSVDLADLTNRLTAADTEATHLDHELQLAYDLAYLDAGEEEKRVTTAEREATARVATSDLRLRTEVAKLNVRSLRAKHRTLDRRIDVGRTQAATVRSEHRTIGYGGAA